jgi:hypothetical protein
MHRRLCCLIGSAVLLAGCADAAWKVDPKYDSSRAIETLKTALDAWQNGKAAGLAKQKPPLRFVDDDYKAGFKLVRYELTDKEPPTGPFASIAVTLTLQRRKAPPIERPAMYQVAVEPHLSVLRSDP